MRTAVIILFHGSRAEGADETAQRIAADVGRRGNFGVVTAAFLQHVKPDLMEAVHACVRQGAGKIVVVPFFCRWACMLPLISLFLWIESKNSIPIFRSLPPVRSVHIL